jgi:hypothetical protein
MKNNENRCGYGHRVGHADSHSLVTELPLNVQSIWRKVGPKPQRDLLEPQILLEEAAMKGRTETDHKGPMTHGNGFGAFVALLSAVMCASLISIPAQATTCDGQTIAGNYGFKVQELQHPATPAQIAIGSFVPAAVIGRMRFDSKSGTVIGFWRGNEGGVPVTNRFNTPTSQSTYSVESDCTGTLNLVLDDGSSRTYEIAIVRGGAEIEFVVTAASLAVVSDGVAKQQPATCDATTIAGALGVRFNRLLANDTGESPLRTFTPADSAGLLHFDDSTSPPSVSGNLTGITDGNSTFTTTVAGIYSVQADCTGTIAFTDNEGATKKLGMAIVKDGADIEIEFANTSQPSDQIVGEGVGKMLVAPAQSAVNMSATPGTPDLPADTLSMDEPNSTRHSAWRNDTAGRCLPKGGECSDPLLHARCCAGLVCEYTGIRGFCTSNPF